MRSQLRVSKSKQANKQQKQQKKLQNCKKKKGNKQTSDKHQQQ
jgi:hypothetical protein